ncbi:hypothetical protein [Streptomyces nigra]|uniref:hypothetical protein n=1 Tax=Streptomyces nigra TaxID=1827580 RepID=UPI003421EDBF
MREAPWERPAAHYDPERMARDDVCPNLWRSTPLLQSAYEELVAFVTGAAERGQGAFMGFAYRRLPGPRSLTRCAPATGRAAGRSPPCGG